MKSLGSASWAAGPGYFITRLRRLARVQQELIMLLINQTGIR